MGLSKGARDRALRGIVAGKLWVGLASTVEGRTVTEVRDEGYARQPITFGEPTHDGARSVIASSMPLQFGFVHNSDQEIRHWFLIDKESGSGEVIATGVVDPQYMLDRKAGRLLTFEESVGKKDLTPVYPRPLAGAKSTFRPGDVWLYIEEE